MAARRQISWSSALRDLRDDRMVRDDIRFRWLKRTETTNALGSWRGKSGQHYVVKCIPLEMAIAENLRDCVAIACRLDDNRVPHIVDVACVPRLLSSGWIIQTLSAGARELHLFSLADLKGFGTQVVSDLTAA